MKLLAGEQSGQRFCESSNVYLQCMESASSADCARVSAAEMLNLLARLEDQVDDDRTWYASTSHLTLCLRTEPTSESRSVVRVSPTGDGRKLAKANGLAQEDTGCFIVEYRIPDSDSPWPEAYVQMTAKSVTECLAAIRIAISRCG